MDVKQLGDFCLAQSLIPMQIDDLPFFVGEFSDLLVELGPGSEVGGIVRVIVLLSVLGNTSNGPC